MEKKPAAPYINLRHRPLHAGDPSFALPKKMGHPDALSRAPGDDERGARAPGDDERERVQ
jgi:hypothetical protein